MKTEHPFTNIYYVTRQLYGNLCPHKNLNIAVHMSSICYSRKPEATKVVP